MADQENSLRKKRKAALILSALELLTESSDEEDDTVLIAAVNLLNSRPPKKMKRHRQKRYFSEVITMFRLDEFRVFFRLSRSSAESLLEHISLVCAEDNISGVTERQGTGGVPQKPLEERLLAMLWFLASQDKYASIADRFNMSESTACDSIRKLLLFISNNLLSRVITWPTEGEQLECSTSYEDAKGFPGVIGMIDGTHIQIRRPKERGIDYYNRKDVYSVVLQAVVKEDLQFVDVYTGWPGKVHDARVFRNSPLFMRGRASCGNRHILADSAYPNLEWILTPYRDNGHLSRSQRKFNVTHASIRSVVERAFGLLKGRFVRLRYIHQQDITTIISTVLTSCVMHNICIKNGDEFAEPLEEEVVAVGQPNVDGFDAGAQQRGATKRDNIARLLMGHDP